MKKVLVALLATTVMVFSLTACSSSDSQSETEISDESSNSGFSHQRPQQQEPQETLEAEDTLNTETAEEVMTEEPEVTESEEAEEAAPSEEAEEAEVSGEEEEEGHAHGNSQSAARSLAKLLSGNNEYLSGSITPDIQDSLRKELSENGQHPYAIVVTCSDSRVPAELIFDAGLGDIFVIRTAGNVVGDFEVGSVEYGAEHLGSPLVLVLGHSNCGAVTAATEGGEAGGSIQAIVDAITPSVEKAKEGSSGEDALLSKAIELNVENSISKLRESEILKELEEEGKVEIIGGVYDITSGNIKILE